MTCPHLSLSINWASYENSQIASQQSVPPNCIPAGGAAKLQPIWVQVIDPVEDYLKILKTIYDFGAISQLLKRPDFKMTFDGLHGVAGPYAKRIFIEVSTDMDPKDSLLGHRRPVY